MRMFETLDLIQRIHRFIRNEHTGQPGEFADKLNISRRTLFRVLDDMRSLGADVQYDKTRFTYFYAQDFNLDIKINVRYLDENEENEIFGGFFYKNFVKCHFWHCKPLTLHP